MPSVRPSVRRAAERAQRKAPDLVRPIRPLLDLALGQAGPGDLRIGVDDGRDGAVVEGRLVPGQALGGDLRLAARLVRQHRSGGDVADREDVRLRGLPLLVHRDPPTLVHLQLVTYRSYSCTQTPEILDYFKFCNNR